MCGFCAFLGAFRRATHRIQNKGSPPNIPKLALEAGSTIGWRNYVGEKGDVIGLNRFGASGPGQVVYEKLGFNVDNLVEHAVKLVRSHIDGE
jgi:transketolase